MQANPHAKFLIETRTLITQSRKFDEATIVNIMHILENLGVVRLNTLREVIFGPIEHGTDYLYIYRQVSSTLGITNSQACDVVSVLRQNS